MGVAINNPDLARLLVKKGADVNLTQAGGESPLELAASLCEINLVRFLLRRGAKINHADLDGVTPLHSAAQGCDSGEMIVLLIANGASLNARDKLGNTPLMAAAFRDNIKAAQELLEAGADYATKNRAGETAVDIACDTRLGRKDQRDNFCSRVRGFLSIGK